MTNEEYAKADSLVKTKEAVAAHAANMLLLALSGLQPLPEKLIQYFDTGSDPKNEIREYYQITYGYDPILISVNDKSYVLNKAILNNLPEGMKIYISS